MKHKLILFGFFLFSFIMSGLVFNVNAISYKPGVNENDELIWKCKVCNKAEMNLIFGPGWNNSGIFTNLSKGMRMKWVINNTIITDSVYQIEFDVWFWTLNKNWGVKDNYSQITYIIDPNDNSEELNFTNYSSLVPFWFPIPVGEYMGSLKLKEWYDVDNRVLPTLNVDISKDAIKPGYPNKDIKIIAIYNDEGILNSYKLYIKGNVVIVDVAFDFLPFYVIPTLIVLFTILSLGVIVYIIRKYKSIRLSSPNLK